MDENENKEPTQEEDESEVTSESPVEEQSPDAGAQDNYGMLLQALQRLEDNQARLESQIAKISDAQSVLVDAGAVVHEGSGTDSGNAGFDEFVPIEQLDLSL